MTVKQQRFCDEYLEQTDAIKSTLITGDGAFRISINTGISPYTIIKLYLFMYK